MENKLQLVIGKIIKIEKHDYMNKRTFIYYYPIRNKLGESKL
jgi:hypothetical protein